MFSLYAVHISNQSIFLVLNVLPCGESTVPAFKKTFLAAWILPGDHHVETGEFGPLWRALEAIGVERTQSK